MNVLSMPRQIGLVMEIFIADFALELASWPAMNADTMPLQVEPVLEVLPTQLAMICQLKQNGTKGT